MMTSSNFLGVYIYQPSSKSKASTNRKAHLQQTCRTQSHTFPLPTLPTPSASLPPQSTPRDRTTRTPTQAPILRALPKPSLELATTSTEKTNRSLARKAAHLQSTILPTPCAMRSSHPLKSGIPKISTPQAVTTTIRLSIQ
jgi:hypothetical protein